MKEKIIAPCGIDCFNCELYEDNVTDEMQARMEKLTKIPKDKVSCSGCKDGNICLFLKAQGTTCKTYDCVKEKGVNYCYECDTFPCEKIMPIADGADTYPHNMKMYNLCLLKRLGKEEFVKQAGDIRKTYFTKKMIIGEGGSKD